MKKLLFILSVLSMMTLTNCKKDKCKDVTCLNGGTCNDGTCQCTNGYEGYDCSVGPYPKSIKVYKIILKEFPMKKDNGSSWDSPSSNPDVAILFYDDTDHDDLWSASTYYIDAKSPGWYKWTIDGGYFIDNPKDMHILYTVDHDAPEAEGMGGIEFVPAVTCNGEKIIEVKSAKFAFEMHCTYPY